MVDVAISGITKLFGSRTILHDIDLHVAAEHVLAILGPSGGGKTTLLRLIAGFERCDHGSIRLGATDVAGPGLHLPPERRQVGYVAQDGALFPHLSVGDNIGFGLPKAERRNASRIAELLELVGLPQGYRSHFPHQLSGGEQQRVALARALAPRPQLVLLDEPFSALDAGLRAETRKSVIAVLRHTRATAILVTHDQGEALSSGDEVAVLLDARVAQIAPPKTLYSKPKTAAVARFLGESNLIPGEIRGSSVSCVLGWLDLDATLADGPAEVLIRSEQITVLDRPAASLPQAKVIATDYYGHGVSVSLEVGGQVLNARMSGAAMVKVGDEVGIRIEGCVTAF